MYHFTVAFPYDLMLISAHANETEGIRVTYQYDDSEKIKRTLTVDEAVSLSWYPEDELFHVTTYIRFVNLDGIDWNSEAKNKYYVGKAILDFIELQKDQKHLDCIIKKEKVNNVKGAMAYKMHDHIFLSMFHTLADENNPVIISNACSSWHKIAQDYIFAGARAYIGPIIDVTNVEAVEVMKSFFKNYLHLPLSIGIWKAQNSCYGD